MIQLQEIVDNPQSMSTALSLTAVIDTALCVGAGGSTGSLADKPIVRNAQGQLLIPGSQLKGRLRHECEKLARGLGWRIADVHASRPLDIPAETANGQVVHHPAGYDSYHCLMGQIFGDPVLPARVLVDDLICPLSAEELPEVLRPGVSINRRRQVAEDKKLFLLETSPANAKLAFSGQIHLLPQLPPQARPLILAGLRHIHALGGSKSAGLGWLSWQQIEWNSTDMSKGISADMGDLDWDSLLPEKEAL